MRWTIEYSDEFAVWWHTLTAHDQDAIIAMVERLACLGPDLGQLVVRSTQDSPHQTRSILLPPGGDTRVFFTVTVHQMTISLIGGDSAGDADAWYDEMMPIGDRLYRQHLEPLRRSGLLP